MSHMSYFYHTFVVFCVFLEHESLSPHSLSGDYVIRHKSHFTGRLWSSWQTIRKVRYINGSVFHLLSTRIFLVRCTDVFGLVCLCFRERVCLLLFSSVWELLNWWMESCRWVENEAVSCRWSAWNAIMPGIGNLPPNILKVTLIRDIQLL